jgi:hypothetical protein
MKRVITHYVTISLTAFYSNKDTHTNTLCFKWKFWFSSSKCWDLPSNLGAEIAQSATGVGVRVPSRILFCAGPRPSLGPVGSFPPVNRPRSEAVRLPPTAAEVEKTRICTFISLTTKKLNSVASVRERTIPTERPSLLSEVGANFCG